MTKIIDAIKVDTETLLILRLYFSSFKHITDFYLQYLKKWKAMANSLLSLTIHIKLAQFLCLKCSMHSVKWDDLAAHLEVDKCLRISPLFQTIFAISFGQYIE